MSDFKGCHFEFEELNAATGIDSVDHSAKLPVSRRGHSPK